MSALLSKVFKRRRQTVGRAGVVLAEDGFALALVRREPEQKPVLIHCAVHAGGADAAAGIKATLEKLAAGRAPLCAVVDGEDYEMVQVEAPDVLPAEMRAAIRWRLRDAITFSVDDAAIDIFDIPEPARAAQARMLWAVAARDSAIKRIALAVQSAAKGFEAIDIPELCLRNICAVLPQDARGVAMLAVHERSCHLVISRQGVMYVTRRIDVAPRFQPHAREREGDQLDAGLIALELQRSLDYYESQYDQTPIGDLVIAPVNDRTRQLADELRSETSLRVSVLDARDLFIVQQSGEPAADWSTLLALGAALRQDASA